MNKIELFKIMLMLFMQRVSDDLEIDRQHILSNISFHRLDSDKYYSLLVNDIRQDYARFIFRSIRIIMDDYL